MSIKNVHTFAVPAGANEQSGVNTTVQTATGNSREFRELAAFDRATFFLDVTVVSGTTPTLDVIIQAQDPISLKWHTVLTFAQQTVVTGTVIAPQTIDLFYTNYRAKWTIGGTTPSFTFSIACISDTSEPITV